MRNIVGKVVRGEDFFKRPEDIRRIWRAIESGSHILISAPRRVGKTSLLFYFIDHPKEDYYFIYILTQSVNNEKEYFRRLFRELVKSECVSTKIKTLNTASEIFQNVLDKIKGFKIVGTGIDFNESEDVDYEDEFNMLLRSLSFEKEKVIIMVDEFPQTIENILKNAGESEAIQFLQSNREIRQNPELSDKCQFIYTGSIGLENIVSQLNAMDLINDLDTVIVKPLPEKNAKLFIKLLLKNYDFTLSEAYIDYLLDEVEWLIPFQLQSVIKAIADIYIEKKPTEIIQETIDAAFDEMLQQRNYFEHWQRRLRKAFPEAFYRFAEDLLSLISKEITITSDQIRKLAVQNNIENEYKYIVRTLVHDGYINNNDDSTIYRFNSPLVRRWWYKHVAN